MIHFVTTRDHAYTMKHLARRLGRDRCLLWQYETLFTHPKLPTGTWVFTDHERLSAYEIFLASRVAHHLEQGGARVLNHPARVARRFDVLRLLREVGINSFSAWRAEARPRPERFPVFIRNEYDHRAGQPMLLPDQATLDDALAALQRDGNPLFGKLVVEYAGEEVSPGIWQRLQTYCVAGTIIAHTNVVDFDWVVKDTKDTKRLYEHPEFDRFIAQEQAFISGNLHADVLRRAFQLAGIEYGRADFALVDGRPQIYEINTNPNHADHKKLFRAIHPRRVAIQKFSEDAVQAALLANDIGGQGRIRIRDHLLRHQQGRRSWLPAPIWRP